MFMEGLDVCTGIKMQLMVPVSHGSAWVLVLLPIPGLLLAPTLGKQPMMVQTFVFLLLTWENRLSSSLLASA